MRARLASHIAHPCHEGIGCRSVSPLLGPLPASPIGSHNVGHRDGLGVSLAVLVASIIIGIAMCHAP